MTYLKWYNRPDYRTFQGGSHDSTDGTLDRRHSAHKARCGLLLLPVLGDCSNDPDLDRTPHKKYQLSDKRIVGDLVSCASGDLPDSWDGCGALRQRKQSLVGEFLAKIQIEQETRLFSTLVFYPIRT